MNSQNRSNPDPLQEQRRCLYCGHFAPLVWVHGHGQCANCGINTDECCRGEACGVWLNGNTGTQTESRAR